MSENENKYRWWRLSAPGIESLGLPKHRRMGQAGREFIENRPADTEDITEALNATDQMAWVQRVNGIRVSTLEVVSFKVRIGGLQRNTRAIVSRGFNFLTGCARPPVGDILCRRSGKQSGILQGHSEVPAKLLLPCGI